MRMAVCIAAIILMCTVFEDVHAAPRPGERGSFSMANCRRGGWQYYDHEGGDWCGGRQCAKGGNEVTVQSGRCCRFCSQEACELGVCDECASGYYKEISPFFTLQGWATACRPCTDIVGCRLAETCTSNLDQQCTQCDPGRYLQQSSGSTRADTCPTCSTIFNCVAGQTRCTTSSDQTCSQCQHGYYQANSNKECRKCQVGCESCKSDSLKLGPEECLACASNYVMSSDSTECLQKCPAGEYSALRGGVAQCVECPTMPGCYGRTECSDPPSESLSCSNGQCLDDSYFVRTEADDRQACIFREPSPNVTALGPDARIEWSASPDSNFYASYDWEAEIEQTSSSDRKTVAVFPAGAGLDLSWRAFNSQPTAERSFRVRLLRVRKADGATSESQWSNTFHFSCECNSLASGRSGKDGEVSVQLVQAKSHVVFNLQYNSYCANSYVVERDVGSGFQHMKVWAADEMDCSTAADNTQYDDLAVRDQIKQSLGREILYRFYARNIAINYEVSEVLSHKVAFWAVVRGAVRSEDMRGAQVQDVRITITFDPAFEGEEGEVLTWSDVTRAKGGDVFEYEIVVQSALLNEAVVPVMVQAQYPATTPTWSDCAALGDECVCSEGLVRLTNGIDHHVKEVSSPMVCDHAAFPGPRLSGVVRCECSRAMHRFDCPEAGERCKVTDATVPPERQTRHVEMNLAHTEEHVVTFLDKSTYTLAGKVAIRDTGSCGLMGVEICPYAADTWSRLPQSCVETNADGEYSLAIPAGRSVTLRPSFRNSTSEDFTVERDTIQRVLSNEIGFNFEYKPQQRVRIAVGGGECFDNIGTFVLTVTMNFCSDYERSFRVSGERELYLGPADFTIRVESFEELVPPLAERIDSGMVMDYLETAKQQTKYVKFWSRQDADSLEAKLDASGAYLEFVYRSRMQLEFFPLPGRPMAQKCGEVPVAAQSSAGTLKVFPYEEYGPNTCRKISGKITIVDQVTDVAYACSQAAGCTVDIDMVDHPNLRSNVSGLQLPLFPGEPELVAPHHRFFTFYWADSGRPRVEEKVEYPVLVTGQRKLGDAFSVTLTEGVPLAILYDPPGGGSFSELVDGVTLSTGVTVTSSDVKAEEFFWDLAAGFDGDISMCSGVGVTMCNAILSVKLEGRHSDVKREQDGEKETSEYAFDHVVESAVTTSSTAHLPGFYSDVVISSAFTVTFEKTRRLEFNPDECGSESNGVTIFDVAVFNPALEGFVVKSFYDIEFTELPKVADNIQTIEGKLDRDEYSDDDDGFREKALDRHLLQQLKATQENWRRLIAAHDARAESEMLVPASEGVKHLACQSLNEAVEAGVEVPCNSIPDSEIFNFGNGNSRIFFSGGGQSFRYSTETTVTSVESHTQTFDMSHIYSWGGTEKLGTMGVYVESNQKNTWTVETHQTTEVTSGTARSRTVTFTLSDPDVGDSFDVEILFDQEYGTPFFKTLAGSSMCPGEAGTVPRMMAELQLQGLQSISSIPQDETVVLPIDVINRSPTDEEDGEYVLLYDQASNPNGLQMSVDGRALEERLLRRIPTGERLRINLEAERGSGQFDFEDIVLQVVPRCELDLDARRFRTDVGAELTFSLHWVQDCPRVLFSGALAADETFTVSQIPGVTRYTLSVMAQNPDHFDSPWAAHPSLQEIYVQYRRVGDSEWERAVQIDGSFANFNTGPDSTGFETVEVDVTFWDDGEYELNLQASCGNEPAPVGSTRSSVVRGLIDREDPRLFSAFAEPADGSWEPGDKIAARMTEPIDCSTPHSFDIRIVVRDADTRPASDGDGILNIEKDNLDISCSGDTVELAFSAYSILYQVPDLMGTRATVYFDNVRDLAGNAQQGTISWSFDIVAFDVSNAAVVLTLQFKDLDLATYTSDPEGFASTVADEVCMLVGCEASAARRQLARPTVRARVQAGSVWADVELPASEESLPLAAQLYERMGDGSAPSTVPSGMLLAGASVHQLTYARAATANDATDSGTGGGGDGANSESARGGASTERSESGQAPWMPIGVGVGAVLLVGCAVVFFMRRRASPAMSPESVAAAQAQEPSPTAVKVQAPGKDAVPQNEPFAMGRLVTAGNNQIRTQAALPGAETKTASQVSGALVHPQLPGYTPSMGQPGAFGWKGGQGYNGAGF